MIVWHRLYIEAIYNKHIKSKAQNKYVSWRIVNSTQNHTTVNQVE